MPLSPFHPLISEWFSQRFGLPTEAQVQGWPAILADRDTLIAAPTGSGKTLAAFLACLDRLIRNGLAGNLSDEIRVVYVSPLKALSNDVQRNLEAPLQEIKELAASKGIPFPEIRVWVRTGDTPHSERRAMLKRPPHILVTTPESLYLLLTAESSRKKLHSVETIIVDEIHAALRDKRGSHLALSLERLERLCDKRPVRIGLSATQRPMEEVAKFLIGSRGFEPRERELEPAPSAPIPCAIIDVGHLRELDLAIETSKTPLSAVCSNEQWKEIYERIAELIQSHRSVLVFVNTRRLAERVTHHLSEILGEDAVASHHGSLSKKLRLRAEARLKKGELKAVVATASLELGIDIGFIDLVIQVASPRSIATFLQRIGRSGHALKAIPKGRLFALTRDELLECAALIRGVRAGRLDRIVSPVAPLDILAQQIVAETACEEWDEDALFDLFQGAYPYQTLKRSDYDAILEMLSEGIAARGTRIGAYLYRDRTQRRIKGRRGARLAALTSGGAIPELADYRVIAEPEQVVVGSVGEDFAVETLAGDVFLLGNTSWRVRHVRGGEVVVSDAHGAAPTIPFWLGEAPARTKELSEEVSLLREEIDHRLGNPREAAAWLMREGSLSERDAELAIEYLAAQKGAVGMIPTQTHLLVERFFDESGGMQLVIHAPFGGRINRAYGLALRKRFCRRFDFELQASADDNGLLLSLGPQQGFPLEETTRMIRSEQGETLLTQALLASPLFTNRWRWNTTRALAVLRSRGGKKVPPVLQRFRADDILSAVFPAATACGENHTEPDIAVPDHPLVRQTMRDALSEATDLEGWLDLLKEIEAGRISVTCVDTREPTPFAYQILNAQPYAFLDDAPLEERRARAVATRRTLSVESLRDIGRLDPDAIEQVRREAWPLVRNADELHDTLLTMGLLPEEEGIAGAPRMEASEFGSWEVWFNELLASGRATRGRDAAGRTFWIAAERFPMVMAARPDLSIDPPIEVPKGVRDDWSGAEGWTALVRGRIESVGPTTATLLSEKLGLPLDRIESVLRALEGEGAVMQGRFTPRATERSIIGRNGGSVSTHSPADQNGGAVGSADARGGEWGAFEDPSPSLPEGPPNEMGGAIGSADATGARGAFEHPSPSLPERPLNEMGGAIGSADATGARGVFEYPSPSLPERPLNEMGGAIGSADATRGVWGAFEDPSPSLPERPPNEIEWCSRRLLARIHRMTLDSLRRQMAPITTEELIQFLFSWNFSSPGREPQGRPGLLSVIEKLQGFEIPASAWEREILPARVPKYEPKWLDELCLSGEVVWGRVRAGQGRGASRVLPISLMLRDDLDWLRLKHDAANGASTGAERDAGEVLAVLSRRGALFFNEIVAEAHLLPTQVEAALWELVARGTISGDGFGAIRSLTSPVREEAERLLRRLKQQGRPVAAPRRGNGRWWIMKAPPEPGGESDFSEEAVGLWARQLLERYGVFFRDLLARESAAPPWKALLPVYRRLESRGEIRGGRFITGVGGEQFALPEVVDRLRLFRREGGAIGSRADTSASMLQKAPDLIVISAADPLNLVGILSAGARVTSLAGNRVAYLAGKYTGHRQGGEIWIDPSLDPDTALRVEGALRSGKVQREETPDLTAARSI